jgi:hypothetical protein
MRSPGQKSQQTGYGMRFQERERGSKGASTGLG